jgi:uncharacterized phage protein (TIGR01671 family)
MREIKFRAWDSELYEMSYSDPLDDLECASSWFNSLEDRDIRASGNIELMQYTGLKDKYGKEIYEGDIVKYLDIMDKDVMDEVMWSFSGFDLRNYDHGHPYDYGDTPWGGVEVIGNIYENPELLKDRKA